jgi:hypothetical protein
MRSRWRKRARTALATRRELGMRGVAFVVAQRLMRAPHFHVEWFVVLEQPPSTPRPMDPDGDVRWARPDEVELLASLGRDPDEVRRRLARGDQAAVLVRDGALVGHMWCRRQTYDEQGMLIQLRPPEAWIYDGVVDERFRGARIYPSIYRAAAEALAASGTDRLLSGIDYVNGPSLRSARARGARAIGSIFMVRVLGLSLRREDWYRFVRWRLYLHRAPMAIPPRESTQPRPVPVGPRS